jgi:hypothetical protein
MMRVILGSPTLLTRTPNLIKIGTRGNLLVSEQNEARRKRGRERESKTKRWCE